MTSSSPIANLPSLRLPQVPAPPSDAAAAGKGFEQLLLGQVLAAMRQTVPGGDEGGFAQDMAMSMLDDALAEAASGSLGLSGSFERHLGGSAASRSSPLRPAPAPTSRAHAGAPPPQHVPPVGPAPDVTMGVVGGFLPSAGDLPILGATTFDQDPDGSIRVAATPGAEIRAVQRGIVTFSGSRPGTGSTVEVRHADGTVARYDGASRTHVSVGDRVDVGEALADVGPSAASRGEVRLRIREAGPAGIELDAHHYLTALRSGDARPGALASAALSSR